MRQWRCEGEPRAVRQISGSCTSGFWEPFLIDPTGKVVKTYLSVDTSRHSTEIVADLKQFKSVARQAQYCF